MHPFQSRSRPRRAAEGAGKVPSTAGPAGEGARKKKRPKPPFYPSAQVGAIAPLGFFDPLGFSKDGDRKGFRQLREQEIKHGRVAMLACTGQIVQHFVHFDTVKTPAFLKTAPTSLGAWTVFWGPPGFTLLLGLLFFSFTLETSFYTLRGREPGDYGDPLGLSMYDDDMRNKELSNGRFAMVAITGILAAELATGKDAVQQLGF